jgi:hypothetical protein
MKYYAKDINGFSLLGAEGLQAPIVRYHGELGSCSQQVSPRVELQSLTRKTPGMFLISLASQMYDFFSS